LAINKLIHERTDILARYSEESIVGVKGPGSTVDDECLDNSEKRSSASDSKSTEAHRAKRTCAHLILSFIYY
jgi:hypothetical protein